MIIRDYYMTFSISALVSARDSHIKPDSEAAGQIWVEGWYMYQGRYGKCHVIIYLSHILHWLFSSIDFYIAEKIFELTNCENKSLRELPLFHLQIFLFPGLYNDVRKCLKNLSKTLTFEWKFIFKTTYTFELIIPFQVYLNFFFFNILKRVNLIEIRVYAPSILVLWHIFFETTAQIPEAKFGGKYGCLRANTDIWGPTRIANTDF